jgi:hypothetical protein
MTQNVSVALLLLFPLKYILKGLMKMLWNLATLLQMSRFYCLGRIMRKGIFLLQSRSMYRAPANVPHALLFFKTKLIELK